MSADVWKGLGRQLRIIGKRYKVLVVEKVDSDDSFGEHSYERQEIKVQEGQGFEAARDSVLHEALHGVEQQMDIGLRETQVTRLATGVLALMRDNPSFVRWLMMKEPKEKETKP